MAKFRFQDFKIWHSAIEIANELFDIADDLERRRLYRWAEQLRGSGMSMSNNIAEGSGSSSKKDFSNFLNIARRSTFENANALILFEMRKLVALVVSLIGGMICLFSVLFMLGSGFFLENGRLVFSPVWLLD